VRSDVIQAALAAINQSINQSNGNFFIPNIETNMKGACHKGNHNVVNI